MVLLKALMFVLLFQANQMYWDQQKIQMQCATLLVDALMLMLI